MRKFLNLIFSILFICRVFLLTISYTSKTIITDTVSGLYTKDKITNSIIEKIDNELPNLSSNELYTIRNKIENSKQIDKITEKYLNGIIDSILDNKVKSVSILEELDNMYNELTINMSSFQKAIIKDKIKSIDLNSVYLDAINTVKSKLSPEMKFALNSYKNITADNTQKTLIISLIFIAFALILTNKSIINGLGVISLDLIIYGILSSIMTFLINSNMYAITKNLTGSGLLIDISILFNISLFVLMIGVILKLIVLFIKKITTKKSN